MHLFQKKNDPGGVYLSLIIAGERNDLLGSIQLILAWKKIILRLQMYVILEINDPCDTGALIYQLSYEALQIYLEQVLSCFINVLNFWIVQNGRLCYLKQQIQIYLCAWKTSNERSLNN